MENSNNTDDNNNREVGHLLRQVKDIYMELLLNQKK